MPWTKVVDLVFQPEVTRLLCIKPYVGHPRGCPNFGKIDRCPPRAPLWFDVYDRFEPCFAIYTLFEISLHVAKMSERHPDWSERQVRNCLYWQGTARKDLKQQLLKFYLTHPEYEFETTPEAMGINVTATMAAAGVTIEWPPRSFVTLVALAGIPRTKPRSQQLELNVSSAGGSP
jgi:predicted metal-binding protein